MRHILTSLTFILTTFASYAVTIEFIGPCEAEPFLSESIKSNQEQTIGELTIATLEKARVPYQGSENGLNQILNSPIGLDAMELISDNEMLAYGWCYEVDGKVLESYPNEINLDRATHISWFYGYAHYLNGTWIAQCLKSHLRRSPHLCKPLNY